MSVSTMLFVAALFSSFFCGCEGVVVVVVVVEGLD